MININKYIRITPIKRNKTFLFGRINWIHVLWHDLVWIYMGAMSTKKELSMHWDDKHGTPLIRKVISRDVWMYLHGILCPYDPMIPENEINKIKETEKDNAYKIMSLVDDFNRAAQYFMHLSQDVSIDDIIKEMHNNTRLKRRCPGKPHDTGLRFWGLCNKIGYCYKLALDCDNAKQKCEKYRKIIDRAGPTIVLYLLDSVGQLGRFVGGRCYIDNWFNHLLLQMYLYKRGIYCTGTLKKRISIWSQKFKI